METVKSKTTETSEASPPSPEGELMETLYYSTLVRNNFQKISPPSPEGELMETSKLLNKVQVLKLTAFA